MPGRSPNAELAVELYNSLDEQYHWSAATAWQGIARLLLTCKIWKSGWEDFRGVVVYRETNDFKSAASGEGNAVMRRAENLSAYLAKKLGVERSVLCGNIGLYWGQPNIRGLQPHNLVGHAFRSLTVNILRRFGDPAITYDEEVDPYKEFPGFSFPTRSKKPSIDIVARRGNKTVALMSTRWRFRHDRVDVVEEALSYASAARRHNPRCELYAVVGEFAPNRLDKILCNCPPAEPRGPLAATVHFAPSLISNGLGENGRLSALKDFEWLIARTFEW